MSNLLKSFRFMLLCHNKFEEKKEFILYSNLSLIFSRLWALFRILNSLIYTFIKIEKPISTKIAVHFPLLYLALALYKPMKNHVEI